MVSYLVEKYSENQRKLPQKDNSSTSVRIPEFAKELMVHKFRNITARKHHQKQVRLHNVPREYSLFMAWGLVFIALRRSFLSAATQIYKCSMPAAYVRRPYVPSF